jgi:energy-coupling factor transporter ATP-binding protein EcfA2
MSLAINQTAVPKERKSAGYHMIKSLHVENFRCFREIDLPDLRRINVIVGKNATGKTALLEAIRLALAGTPASLWTMNQSRAFFTNFPQPPSREQFEAIWSPYFFDFNISSKISTECRDSEGQEAVLKVYFDPQKSVTTVPQQQPQQQPPSNPTTIVPLAFERVDFAGKPSTLYGSVNAQGGYVLEPGPELGVSSELLPSALFSNPHPAVQWFSQLSVQKREKEIVDAVREEFEPSLENLAVISLGQIPSIYASIRYLKEKLPVSLLSAGITKFIVLLAAVLIRGRGVVLIDEIENGLFYKTLGPLWKYLLKIAINNDTQVFVTTHSQECVRALVPAMQGHEDDFALLRSERAEDSSDATVTLLQGKFLEAAIEQGVEVR